MKMLIFALCFVGLSAQAQTRHFTCQKDNNAIQIEVAEKYVNGNSQGPGWANVDFTFNNKNYNWRQVQYISMTEDFTAIHTQFSQQEINTLYIDFNISGNQAYVHLKLGKENFYWFDCQMTFVGATIQSKTVQFD